MNSEAVTHLEWLFSFILGVRLCVNSIQYRREREVWFNEYLYCERTNPTLLPVFVGTTLISLLIVGHFILTKLHTEYVFALSSATLVLMVFATSINASRYRKQTVEESLLKITNPIQSALSYVVGHDNIHGVVLKEGVVSKLTVVETDGVINRRSVECYGLDRFKIKG